MSLHRFLSVLALVFLLSLPGSAWNKKGHIMIARMAWGMLDSGTQKALDRILAKHPASYVRDVEEPMARNRFEAASSWPDQPDIALRGPLHDAHFIDIPVVQGKVSVHLAPVKTDLLRTFPRVLANATHPQSSEGQRAENLSRVIHLLGDAHQPLHCAALVNARHPAGDRGGNDCLVLRPAAEGGRKRSPRVIKLHALWDAGVGIWYEDDKRVNLDAVARSILRMGPEASQVGDLNPRTWADESHKLAGTVVYGPLQFGRTIAFSDQDCGLYALDETYLRKARRVCRLRMHTAAHRLARLSKQRFGQAAL